MRRRQHDGSRCALGGCTGSHPSQSADGGLWEDPSPAAGLYTAAPGGGSPDPNKTRGAVRAGVGLVRLGGSAHMETPAAPPSPSGRQQRSSLDMEANLPLLAKLREGSGDGVDGEQSAPVPTIDGQGPSLPAGKRSPDGWKYLVALCAVSVVICYADRSNISTAVLPMSEHFGWDKTFQGFVLSSFFSGYALTQVLGGRLADTLGGKLVLASGVGLWSLFTALTPEAAAAGTVPLIAARVLLGVGEGVAFPSIHSLIARNVPQAFQSTAVGVVTAASYVGTALAFGISPMIITQLGWQWVFYLFAALALLWLPLWLPVTVTDTALQRKVSGDLPATDSALPGPNPQLGGDVSGAGGSATAVAQRYGFWALLRRKEVWAICAAQYCQSWGMYGLLNWLPTFFKDYYHVEIADLASYTLLPYVVQGGVGLLSGIIADQMMAKGWGVRDVRVLLQSAGMLGPALCLMLAVSPIVGASASVASSLITVGLGFSALSLGGVSASHLDIAPRHAGVIFGAGNTSATLAGLLSVPFTGYLLQVTDSWPLVFGVTAGHYVLGTALWMAWVGDKPLPEDADPALKIAEQRA